MRELPKICNRIKQDLYNLYKYVQESIVAQIDNVNASLDQQGLLNKFDGKLKDGYWSDSNGSWNDSGVNHFSSENAIGCSGAKTVTVKYEKVVTNKIRVVFYNSSNAFVSCVEASGTDKFIANVPSNATSFNYTIIDTTSGHNTIATCYKISVFVNNAIDEVKANLIKTQTVRNSITVGANSSTSFNVLVDDIGTTIDKVISFDSYPNYDANSSNLRIHFTRFNAGFNVQVYNSSNNEISNNIASVVTFLGL